jgi:hypothetical protein
MSEIAETDNMTDVLMDVRIGKSEGEGDAASRDLQQVRAKVVVNHHLDPSAAARVFQDVGQSTGDVVARILEPARAEAVKAVTARFTAEELITRRTQLRQPSRPRSMRISKNARLNAT